MNLRELRQFLLRAPKPISIRVTDEDEAQHVIEIEGQSWTRLAESVAAFRPLRIECINSKGNSIRAIRPDWEDSEDGAEASSSSSSTSSGSSSSSKRKPPALALPSVADLEPFARMIADAYKHGYEVAFGKLVQLYEAGSERLASMESLYQSEQERRREELEAREEAAAEREEELATREEELAEQGTADPKGELLNELASTFFAGKATGQAETNSAATSGAETNGAHTNGAAKPKTKRRRA